MRSHRSIFLLLGCASIPCARDAHADTLIKKDGTAVEVQKAREEGDSYHLWFEVGELVVPRIQVASVEIEGDMSDYQPKDDKEKAYLAQGYVKHRGKWMSKPAYEAELQKAAEARRKRTAELAARAQFENGWEVESRHFKFKSNTSPEILGHYVDLIEAYYDLMDSNIGIKPSPVLARTKMRVNVYKRQKEMIEYAGEEGIDESVLGYFSPWKQTLNFFHDYKDPARSEVTALHECTHLLTYLIDPNYWAQIWLDEGVADYFGSCTIETVKGKVRLVPGRLEEDSILTMQQAIADKQVLPLQKLFETLPDDYDGFHYAHGWSFVYFVQNTPKYQKTFKKLFQDLYGLKLKDAQIEVVDAGEDDRSGMRRRYAPKAIVDAMLKSFGVKELQVLEKEWLAFVSNVRIEGPRARFLRGYDHAFDVKTAKDAVADLDAAIQGGYARAEAFWARAYARLYGDDVDSARADFEKAIELEPLDGNYHASYAGYLTGWWGKDSPKLHGGDEEKAAAKLHFGLASALEPENEELAGLFAEFLEASK